MTVASLFTGAPDSRGRRLGIFVCAVVGLSFTLTDARANDVSKDGLFITVRNPITDAAVSNIEQQIKDAVEREGSGAAVDVGEQGPVGDAAPEVDQGRCLRQPRGRAGNGLVQRVHARTSPAGWGR